VGKSRTFESAWCRGWSDTKKAWTSWQFLLLNLLGGGLVSGLSQFFLQQWFWGVVVAIAGLLVVLVGATVSAPVKQRNEARKQVEELQKPDKNQDIRDSLAIFRIDGAVLQSWCFRKNEPAPLKEAKAWLAKVIKYATDELGIEYMSTFMDTDVSKFSNIEFASPDHRLAFAMVSNAMEQIQELIKELRNQK
jgi:hypothetical protein